jgi:enterochelin esterase-like enzyme
MKKLPELSFSLLVAVALAPQLACSSGSSDSTAVSVGGSSGAPAGGAGGASAAAGVSGAPIVGQAGGTSGGAPGSAGASGAASGGSAPGSAGSSGSAGTAGNAGSAGQGGAAPFGPIKCSPTGTGDGTHSLPSSMATPAEWTLGAGVTAGKVSAKADFVSTTYMTDDDPAHMGAAPNHFSYWIYTSANYVSGQPAIFLLFGDGDEFLTDFHVATVLDNLTAAHDIPPTVALFIDPPSDGKNAPTEGDRETAYDRPTPKYGNFLFNEILPQQIFGKYSVSRDPNAFSEVGYSASGGQGWEVLWTHPDDIHKFIGVSSSTGAAITYGTDWVKVVTMAAPGPQLRVSLTTSTKDLSDNRGSWQTINTNMAAALTAKNDQVRLNVYQATCADTGCAHYPPVDGERDLPNALRWMFQGCTF